VSVAPPTPKTILDGTVVTKDAEMDEKSRRLTRARTLRNPSCRLEKNVTQLSGYYLTLSAAGYLPLSFGKGYNDHYGESTLDRSIPRGSI